MENKVMKKLIIVSAAVFFAVAITNSASAYYGHYAYSTDPVGYEYEPVVYTNGIPAQYQYQPVVAYNPQPGYYQQTVYSTNSTTPSTSTPSVVNNYYYQTAPSTTKATTTTTTNTSNTTSNKTNTNSTATPNTQENTSGNVLGASAYNPYMQGNGITALSLRGSGSFMPSSIWQWIVVVILILAIIVVARMFVHKPDPADHAHAH